MFTPKQIQDIIELLQLTHWNFVAETIGIKYIPESVLKHLKTLGFNEKKIFSYPELAFHFGMLSSYMKDKEVRDLTFDQLKRNLKARKYLPLSEEERFALEIVEQRAVEGITGLGNRISNSIRGSFIENNVARRKEYEKVIKDSAKKAILKRQTVKQLATTIAEKTKDWNRDLTRVSQYILHTAYDEGRAASIKRQYGDDALVFKRVDKDACDHCHRLYEKSGKPRIFKLNELVANGNNIGRKTSQWKPIIGATHPYCRCTLEYLPSGYEWKDNTKSFAPKINKRDFRKQLKVKVTRS